MFLREQQTLCASHCIGLISHIHTKVQHLKVISVDSGCTSAQYNSINFPNKCNLYLNESHMVNVTMLLLNKQWELHSKNQSSSFTHHKVGVRMAPLIIIFVDHSITISVNIRICSSYLSLLSPFPKV